MSDLFTANGNDVSYPRMKTACPNIFTTTAPHPLVVFFFWPVAAVAAPLVNKPSITAISCRRVLLLLLLMWPTHCHFRIICVLGRGCELGLRIYRFIISRLPLLRVVVLGGSAYSAYLLFSSSTSSTQFAFDSSVTTLPESKWRPLKV